MWGAGAECAGAGGAGGAIGGGGAGGGSGDTAAGENDAGASGDCAMEKMLGILLTVPNVYQPVYHIKRTYQQQSEPTQTDSSAHNNRSTAVKPLSVKLDVKPWTAGD